MTEALAEVREVTNTDVIYEWSKWGIIGLGSILYTLGSTIGSGIKGAPFSIYWFFTVYIYGEEYTLKSMEKSRKIYQSTSAPIQKKYDKLVYEIATLKDTWIGIIQSGGDETDPRINGLEEQITEKEKEKKRVYKNLEGYKDLEQTVSNKIDDFKREIAKKKLITDYDGVGMSLVVLDKLEKENAKSARRTKLDSQSQKEAKEKKKEKAEAEEHPIDIYVAPSDDDEEEEEEDDDEESEYDKKKKKRKKEPKWKRTLMARLQPKKKYQIVSKKNEDDDNEDNGNGDEFEEEAVLELSEEEEVVVPKPTAIVFNTD